MTVTPYDIGWLAGIIDGEGSFTVHSKGLMKPSSSLQVASRYDDMGVQKNVRRILGCGTIYFKDPSKEKDCMMCVYRVSRSEDLCKKVIPILDKCDFFTRKREEYLLWKELVILCSWWLKKRSSHMPDDVLDEMRRLREELSAFKDDNAIPGKLNPEDRVRMEGYLAKPLVTPT